MKVYGPETHITAVVPMALGLQEELPEADLTVSSTPPPIRKTIVVKNKKEPAASPAPVGEHTIVTADAQTTSIVYGTCVNMRRPTVHLSVKFAVHFSMWIRF